MEAPSLIRIPDKSLTNKESERNVPKLVKIPNSFQNSKSTLLYRVPFHETSGVQPQLINVSTKHSIAPKLLNLKPILSRYSTSRPETLKTDLKTVPKLIRLPYIYKTQQTQLLESPKRSFPTSPKHAALKPVDLPQLVDLRPFSPRQPKQLISFDEKENKEDIRLVRTPDVPYITSPPPVLLSKKKKKNTKADTGSDSSYLSSPKHQKRRKHREDELYGVITDLLIERKRHKRKAKRIKLFDVIDNLPLTSDNETDSDYELTTKHRRKTKTKTKPSNIFDSTGHVFLPQKDSFQAERISSLPDVPKTFQQTSSHTQAHQAGNSKPKLSRFLEPFNKEDDPLSWLNIIRTSRNETKETQTDKSQSYSNSSKHQEIQTEMKEMIEIPRSETFFPIQNKEYKATKEFCERVREEVLEKLENKIPLENKRTQTVVHSRTQTEPLEEYNEEETQNIIVSKRQKSKSYSKSEVVTIDPKIYSTVTYGNQTEQFKAKQFINVVDIDSPITERVTEKVIGESMQSTSKTVAENSYQTNADVIYERPVSKSVGLVELNKNASIDKTLGKPINIISASSSSAGYNRDLDYQKKNDISVPYQFSRTPQKTLPKKPSDQYERKTTSHRSAGTAGITENVKSFSYGVEALQELHENLEKELKESKLLFNTIVTLQDGFDPDIQEEAVKKYEDNEMKFRIHHEPDISPKHPEVRNNNEHLEEEINSVVDTNAHNMEPTDMQLDDRDIENNLQKHFVEPTDNSIDQDKTHEDHDLHLEFSPRNTVLTNKGSFTHKSFLDDNRNMASTNKTSSLVKFSHEILMESLDDEDLGYQQASGIDHEEKQRKLEQDNIFREEIRKRLVKQPSEDELNSKKENIKREQLRKWMKEKHQERSARYKEELVDKRTREFKPFIAKRSITKKEIDENTTIQHDLKRALLDENNKERIDIAERLANDVITPKGITNQQTSSGRKKFSKIMHKTNNNITPIRETRSSRMRKNALLKDVLKHTSRITRSKPRKKTGTKKPLSTVTTHGKTKELDSFGGETYGLDHSFNHSYGGHGMIRRSDGRSMDRSFGGRSMDRSFGVLSNRSVDADDFVTKDSYERYQHKTSKMLKETLRDFQTGKIFEDEETLLETEENFKPRMTYKPVSRDDHTRRHQATSNSLNVNTILQQYGLNVDGEFLDRDSSTSNLLAEVDLALAYDTDGSTYSQTVDWNEVEKILNE